MPSPPVPPAFQQLESREFSFFPAIVGIEHNLWRFQQANWSEVLVANCKTGSEIWISRRYIGEASTEEPIAIVGLTREFEYKGGMLCPYHKRVLKMPPAMASGSEAPEADDPDARRASRRVRLEPSDVGVLKLIAVAVGCAMLLYVVGVNFQRIKEWRPRRVVYTVKDQGFLELTPRDDRFEIVQKLGEPGRDHSQEVGTIFYESLAYPDRRYTVILMGSDVRSLAYVGTMDDNWRPVHFISLRSGATTESLLRVLPKF
ncbi:MAG: hypothetical protein ABSF25_08985 [Bryobacteraceae bacterium]|jgi:hypothetical protein